ncbi:MAG: hypothetical protein ACYTEX_21275 [Planctomycetota bacterium]|jgi:hypothetical protein
MKYDFSSHFLKVSSTDSDFGHAWETLCFELLSADGRGSLVQFASPDRGIDIWDNNNKEAFQCKSSRSGAGGTIDTTSSLDSLRRAVDCRASIDWNKYTFAVNARYTGEATIRIYDSAVELGIDRDNIGFLGPDFWSELCERHYERVSELLDYRLVVTEDQVKEALKKARYYDRYVKKYTESVAKHKLRVALGNNRTPLVLEIPFSPDLTVEDLLNVGQSLLELELKTINFADLGTSFSPSISITLEGYSQPFSKSIVEILEGKEAEKVEDLKFHITVVWEEKQDERGTDGRYLASRWMVFRSIDRSTYLAMSQRQKRERRLDRAVQIIEGIIWNAAANIAQP